MKCGHCGVELREPRIHLWAFLVGLKCRDCGATTFIGWERT